MLYVVGFDVETVHQLRVYEILYVIGSRFAVYDLFHVLHFAIDTEV
ncbi:hypothetical protein IJU97_01945 [bacterium]|nr:hypothetical protein [bacterium]